MCVLPSQQMEESPLMTQSLKREQAEAAFDCYERIIIRVQFPDRLVLQALFRPREKGKEIFLVHYTFYLYIFILKRDDIKLPFYLI